VNYTPNSDSMGLDGDEPLSPEERLHLRKLMRDDERLTWARRKAKVIVPALIALVIGIWQLIDWLRLHVTFK